MNRPVCLRLISILLLPAVVLLQLPVLAVAQPVDSTVTPPPGDWRSYYDTARVARASELAGRKVYGVLLESAGLPPMRVSLDAKTGDVPQTQQAMWFPGAGWIPPTTTYSDYCEVGGLRVPHQYIVSTETGGRTIFQVEGVELAPDTFALQPSTDSGGK